NKDVKNTLSIIVIMIMITFFFFSSRRRHTRFSRDWSSDVCSSDLQPEKWNGVKYYYFGETRPQWQCDTALDDAIYYGNDWYFERLSQNIKIKDYNYFIEESGYTQNKFSKPFAYSWNFSDFIVTPEEQVKFLIGLFNQNLPFDKDNQKWVKEQMFRHDVNDYILYNYEGYTVYQAEHIDWLIGV